MHKAPKYPIVECDAHPGVSEPGYMVCNHIKKPTDVAYLDLATEDKLGCISCQTCEALSPMTNDQMFKNFYVCCAAGLKENGILSSDKVN